MLRFKINETVVLDVEVGDGYVKPLYKDPIIGKTLFKESDFSYNEFEKRMRKILNTKRNLSEIIENLDEGTFSHGHINLKIETVR